MCFHINTPTHISFTLGFRSHTTPHTPICFTVFFQRVQVVRGAVRTPKTIFPNTEFCARCRSPRAAFVASCAASCVAEQHHEHVKKSTPKHT
mmetsp:Transcript_62871/g.123506  ORF Transcript_62871/g.123506 Transcript_62871/m.123506 type:complete len:92 (+) Transcript_62871:180-455(+)